MTPMNQYQQYQRSKILTASPAELTLMLYDGAIKFCNMGIAGCEQKNIQMAHDNIAKVRRIIENFRVTLDMKYEVSKDFERVYVYLLQRLDDANITKDPEVLKEVRQHLHSMRDTWKQVMDINAGKIPPVQAQNKELVNA